MGHLHLTSSWETPSKGLNDITCIVMIKIITCCMCDFHDITTIFCKQVHEYKNTDEFNTVPNQAQPLDYSEYTLFINHVEILSFRVILSPSWI